MKYYKIIYSSELKHHGIKGQKWGQTNGPPYPLGASKHSKSEVKAGWRSSLKKNSTKSKVSRKHKSKARKYWDSLSAEEKAYLVGSVALVGASAAVTAYGIKQGYLLGSMQYTKGLMHEFSNTPLTKLSDQDRVIEKGKVTLQRIIRETNPDSVDLDAAREVVWATNNPIDDRRFRATFNARGEGKKVITTRELVNDLKIPSPRKRVKAFAQLYQTNPKFAQALHDDFGPLRYNHSVYTNGNVRLGDHNGDINTSRKLYKDFIHQLGNKDSKSAKIYFDKIRSMGYNALQDDYDTGFMGDDPIILLNANKDSVLTGQRYYSTLDDIIDTMLAKHMT